MGAAAGNWWRALPTPLLARAWLLAMKPSRDILWIDRQHTLSSEMRLLLGQGISPSLGGLFDPTQLTDKGAHPGSLAGAGRDSRPAVSGG